MPTHLPPSAMLADYASGAATPGVALLIATQATQVPETLERIGELERLGAALMQSEPAMELDERALDAVLAKLDEPDAGAMTAQHHDAGPLPQPLIDAIGRDFNALPWKFRLPGVSEYVLEGFEGERVSLLRAKPGSGVPQHTHQGRELTLILTGAMHDGDAVYRAGDLAVNDEHVDHSPRIVGDEICHCLIVMEGRIRFTGRFSRALNLLAE